MSKKLSRRVNIEKVKITDNRPPPEPAEEMVAPLLEHPMQHQPHYETIHPFGQKVSPLCMDEISTALPLTKSSAIFSQSSNVSRTKSSSRPSSRSTYCSGYDSANETGTIIVHDYGSDFGESGTSFMSWSDDIDQDTTKKLQDMYDDLEKFLYDEGDFPAQAGEELLEECLLWKRTFPYKRSKIEDQETSDGNFSVVGGDNSLDSRGRELSQAIWKDKVTDLVVENLSSFLISQIIETVASSVNDVKNQWQEEKSGKNSSMLRSKPNSRRTSARVTRLPAVHQKNAVVPKTEMKLTKVNIDKMLQDISSPALDRSVHFSKNANLSLLDSCLGISSFSESQQIFDITSESLSVFGQTVTPRNSLLPAEGSEDRNFYSAIPRPLKYLSPADRRFSAFGTVFAGRKSPRQEAILKSLQEERDKCSAKPVKKLNTSPIMDSNQVPMSFKPPWIGFSNVALPPIDYLGEACIDEGAAKNNTSARNRKISPSPLPPPLTRNFFSPMPLEVHGSGISRLNVANKLVENMSQPKSEFLRKFKK